MLRFGTIWVSGNKVSAVELKTGQIPEYVLSTNTLNVGYTDFLSSAAALIDEYSTAKLSDKSITNHHVSVFSRSMCV